MDMRAGRLREKYNHARHNLFEYNEISHSVQLLSDGNGIYVSGTGTGNIIRYNYLHDNLAHSLPAAIRCDDDQHETLIYGNVLYNNAAFLRESPRRASMISSTISLWLRQRLPDGVISALNGLR